jgi:hypothetical protein
MFWTSQLRFFAIAIHIDSAISATVVNGFSAIQSNYFLLRFIYTEVYTEVSSAVLVVYLRFTKFGIKRIAVVEAT